METMHVQYLIKHIEHIQQQATKYILNDWLQNPLH